MTNEIERLEKIAISGGYAEIIDKKMVEYTYEIFKRFFNGSSFLELGPAEGVMTELLYSENRHIVAVEGSKKLAEDLKYRFPKVEVHHSIFEEFITADTFDNILLGHVLEHVLDPVLILKKCKNWLKKKSGKIIAAVPNAHSLHRQAAVLMGILKSENELGERDLQIGHRRVFTPEEFKKKFELAGYEIEKFGGYFLKPLTFKQMESLPINIIDAYLKLGEQYPEISGEIYIVARY